MQDKVVMGGQQDDLRGLTFTSFTQQLRKSPYLFWYGILLYFYYYYCYGGRADCIARVRERRAR